MNVLAQMYITVSFLLATFGSPDDAIEAEPNDIHKMIDVMYENAKVNNSAANDSATLQENVSEESRESLELYADYGDSFSREDTTNDENITKSDTKDEDSHPSNSKDIRKMDNKLLYNYIVPVRNNSDQKKPPSLKEHDKEARNENVEEDEQATGEDKEGEVYKGDLEDEEEEEGAEEDRSLRIEDELDEPVEDEQESSRSEADGITNEESEDEAHYEKDEDGDGQRVEVRRYPKKGQLCSGARHGDENVQEEHYASEADESEDDLGHTEEEDDSDLRVEKENKLNEPSTTRPTDYAQTYEPHSRIKPFLFEFTTMQPYRDPKPVSYSSVVYDPVGTPKSELSGSFYQKPLRLMPSSNVFHPEHENRSEDAEAVSVTAPSASDEKAIQAPLYDDEEDVAEYMEAVTTNVNYAIDEMDKPIPHKKILNLNPIIPVARHSFDWRRVKPEVQDRSNEMRNHDGQDDESRESITKYAQLLNMYVDEDDVDSTRESEAVETSPVKYNEKTREKFLDQTNRENYFEQTINTRFGLKEKEASEGGNNYESEVHDLVTPMEAQTREEPGRDGIQNENSDSVDDEESAEEITQASLTHTKDRNQLYEYVDDDRNDSYRRENSQDANERLPAYRMHQPRENLNAVKADTENNTEPPIASEAGTTEKEHETTEEDSDQKPKHRAFGNIVKQQTDQFLPFKNRNRQGDAIYNEIVSSIRSRFTTPPSISTADYEQHILPSHGNCLRHDHDSDNYESFVRPSKIHPQPAEDEEQEEEDSNEDYGDENNPMPGGARIPMKTYALQKRMHPMQPIRVAHDKIVVRKREGPPRSLRPVRSKPSHVKYSIYPNVVSSRESKAFWEARPAAYTNSIHLVPSPSENALVKKTIYYEPKVTHISPSSQIMRIFRSQNVDRMASLAKPSTRRIIIREL